MILCYLKPGHLHLVFYVKHRERKKNRYRNEQMLFIEVKNEK